MCPNEKTILTFIQSFRPHPSLILLLNLILRVVLIVLLLVGQLVGLRCWGEFATWDRIVHFLRYWDHWGGVLLGHRLWWGDRVPGLCLNRDYFLDIIIVISVRKGGQNRGWY